MILNRSSKYRGVTLIELLIAIIISSVALLATGTVTRMSQQALKVAAVQADLEATALNIVDNIANEIKDSGKKYTNFRCSPYPTSTVLTNTLRFSRCSGFAGLEPTFTGEDIQYAPVISGTGARQRYCLQRTTTSQDGTTSGSMIVTDALSGTLRIYNGLNFRGIDFRLVPGTTNVVQITCCLEGRNFLTLQNGVANDDLPLVFAQTRVQLKQ
jgi:prepilin-type N-terminal cleavage/methylation domain-containing protein